MDRQRTPIEVRLGCPGCDETIALGCHLNDDLVGRSARCPACGAELEIEIVHVALAVVVRGPNDLMGLGAGSKIIARPA
jgi:transcription elongation factor Elf1